MSAQRKNTRPCSVDGCDKPYYGRGWCLMHYTRWRRHGDPLKARRTRTEEFWRRVDQTDDPNACWPWRGSVRPDGYGAFYYRGDDVLAHRESYTLNVGPVPDGLQLDHLCRNRACVRPDHLEPVTQKVNVQRGIAGVLSAARQKAKTHCPQGHPYSGDNVYVAHRHGRNPERQCRTCRAAATRKYANKKAG